MRMYRISIATLATVVLVSSLTFSVPAGASPVGVSVLQKQNRIFSTSLKGNQHTILTDEEVQKAKVFSTLIDAGDYVRSQMLSRSKKVVLSMDNSYCYQDGDSDRIIKEAVKHTGNSIEGDYLNSDLKCYSTSIYLFEGKYTFCFAFDWYTTKQQEEAVDAQLAAIESKFDLSATSTDEEIIKAVYDYLIKNMNYDYGSYNKEISGTEDSESSLSHSVYSAVIKKKAVCQSFTALMYRVLLDFGVNCRIVYSDYHTWNAVECNGKWYYCDITSDLEQESINNASYFLVTKQQCEEDDAVYQMSSDLIELDGYDWATSKYYTLERTTVSGFKDNIICSKTNGTKQKVTIIDSLGNKLTENCDYKLEYTGKGSKQQLAVRGINLYSNSSLVKDYTASLATPKITEVVRQTKKEKGKAYVRFRIAYTPVYGATHYEAKINNFSVLKTTNKSNTLLTSWKTATKELKTGQVSAKLKAYSSKQRDASKVLNDKAAVTSKNSKMVKLPKNKLKVTFKRH